MKLWQGMLLWLGIIALAFWLPWTAWFTIIGTSIWAAVDSSKVGLHRYKSQIAVKPFVLFIALLILWIVVFPWYLYERHRIKKGAVQLKDKYAGEAEATKQG